MRARLPVHLSASVLNADFGRLGDEVRRAAKGGVDSIHLDVMDGRFVPNISFGAPIVRALRPRTDLPFHAHLMVEDPERLVADFAAAGSDLIVTHVEASADPSTVIRAIRATGARAGLALNPETDAAAVVPYLDRIDLLLVMTVHPGFGGQRFLDEALPKLTEDASLDDYLEKIERSAIEKALAQTNQNKTAAAKLLGISFRALRYKLEKLGIE